MKNTKIMLALSQWTITLLLPFVLLLSILQVFAFDKNFYLKEFAKYDIPSVTKISMENLEQVTIKLIDYLKDHEKDLNMQTAVDGENREVFGERAKQHMVDVKVLFLQGYTLRNIGVALVILAALYLSWKKDYEAFSKGILNSGLLSLVFIIMILFLITINFNKYFTIFHEIFFTNDLWLLDPETEVLIQMLPLEFFIDISTKVMVWFSAVMISMSGLSFYRLQKISNKS